MNATGSGSVGIYYEAYHLKLITVSGGYLVVNYIELTPLIATEEYSWGAIKAQLGR